MSARNAAAPAAPEEALFHLLDAAESALGAAEDLTVLVAWIEDARHLTDAVASLAGMDQVFREKLRKADIAFNAAIWDEPQSLGLGTLHGFIEAKISEGAEGVRRAAVQDRAGRKT